MNQFSNETPPSSRPRTTSPEPLDWERWVPGWEGDYSVTRGGDIISYKSWHPVKMLLATHEAGYLRVNLRRRALAKTFYVHRLVAAAFLGDPSDLEVDHLNGVRNDNRVENLEIVTHAENLRRAPTPCGSRLSPHLVEADIVEIRRRRCAGEMYKEIAKDYPVSSTAIGSICRRVTWRHVE